MQVGSRLRSAVCDTEVIVVRAPDRAVSLFIGGVPAVAADAAVEGLRLQPGHDTGTELGKRYVDDSVGLELLCVKAGQGSLDIEGRPLVRKQAKPLPSSD